VPEYGYPCLDTAVFFQRFGYPLPNATQTGNGYFITGNCITLFFTNRV
jgi:hypothetical protein